MNDLMERIVTESESKNSKNNLKKQKIKLQRFKKPLKMQRPNFKKNVHNEIRIYTRSPPLKAVFGFNAKNLKHY